MESKGGRYRRSKDLVTEEKHPRLPKGSKTNLADKKGMASAKEDIHTATAPKWERNRGSLITAFDSRTELKFTSFKIRKRDLPKNLRSGGPDTIGRKKKGKEGKSK